MQKSVIKIVIRCIVFLCLISAHAQAADHKVLLLNSYHKGFPWTDNIVAGVESVLRPDDQHVELVVEYLDTKTMGFKQEYREILYELFKYKYQDHDFDLVISSDDNAFNFLKEFHEDLFPGAAVVFCGLNNPDAPLTVSQEIFTGVLETTAPQETIDLILRLHPETEKIVLIIDTTPSGNIGGK